MSVGVFTAHKALINFIKSSPGYLKINRGPRTAPRPPLAYSALNPLSQTHLFLRAISPAKHINLTSDFMGNSWTAEQAGGTWPHSLFSLFEAQGYCLPSVMIYLCTCIDR